MVVQSGSDVRGANVRGRDVFGKDALGLGFAGPLYKQVAALLRAKICRSEWTAHAPLPNEVSLARAAGVSVGTMRKALELLEEERLIERHQGRGTFVVEASDETEVRRFSNVAIGARKVMPDGVAWRCVEGLASAEEARGLDTFQGAGVYRLTGTWRAGAAQDNGRSVAGAETVTVFKARFPELCAHVGGAGLLLFPVYRRHYNVVVARVTDQLAPVAADRDIAARLGIAAGMPVLDVARVAYDPGGAVVEYARRHLALGAAHYVTEMT